MARHKLKKTQMMMKVAVQAMKIMLNEYKIMSSIQIVLVIFPMEKR